MHSTQLFFTNKNENYKKDTSAAAETIDVNFYSGVFAGTA